MGGARSKTSFFRVFRVPFRYPAHSLQEIVLPQGSSKNSWKGCAGLTRGIVAHFVIVT